MIRGACFGGITANGRPYFCGNDADSVPITAVFPSSVLLCNSLVVVHMTIMYVLKAGDTTIMSSHNMKQRHDHPTN